MTTNKITKGWSLATASLATIAKAKSKISLKSKNHKFLDKMMLLDNHKTGKVSSPKKT